MSEQTQKFVNTLLDSQQLNDFERVKAYHGISSNSETVRFLIRQEARRIERQRIIQDTELVPVSP